jgi:hypothetical protein
MKNKILLFLLVCTLAYFSSYKAVFAGWTQPKGHAYNQLTFSHYSTGKKFTTVKFDASENITGTGGEVNRVQTAGFTSTKISYYGEYGIVDTLTVFLSGGWDWQESDDTIRYSGENGPSGIGDINLGLRYNLFQNLLGNVVSFQGEVKIPEAYDYKNPLKFLSLGDGQYDLTLAFVLGRGLPKGYAWFNAGYKFRFENDKFSPVNFKPSDQIKVSFGGGYPVTSWLSIRGLLDWTKSIGNASVSEALIAEEGTNGIDVVRLQDNVLIRDTLGLEPDALSAGIDLAFNIKPAIQTVLSYTRDLRGFKPFKSKDWALGETWSLALVYLY